MAEVDPALHQFSGRGWLLDPGDRARLLQRFPPVYADVVAHHVSFAPTHAFMPDALGAAVVGRADDGSGVEALVVSIGGTTHRPDGGRYHITWSLDRAGGRRAADSNRVIAERGWTALEAPVPIRLAPGSGA